MDIFFAVRAAKGKKQIAWAENTLEMSFGGLELMMYTCTFAPVLLIIVAVCFSPVGVLHQTMFTSYN